MHHSLLFTSPLFFLSSTLFSQDFISLSGKVTRENGVPVVEDNEYDVSLEIREN